MGKIESAKFCTCSGKEKHILPLTRIGKGWKKVSAFWCLYCWHLKFVHNDKDEGQIAPAKLYKNLIVNPEFLMEIQKAEWTSIINLTVSSYKEILHNSIFISIKNLNFYSFKAQSDVPEKLNTAHIQLDCPVCKTVRSMVAVKMGDSIEYVWCEYCSRLMALQHHKGSGTMKVSEGGLTNPKYCWQKEYGEDFMGKKWQVSNLSLATPNDVAKLQQTTKLKQPDLLDEFFSDAKTDYQAQTNKTAANLKDSDYEPKLPIHQTRNFWVEVEIDGQKTILRGGPKAKNGKIKIHLYQNDKGEAKEVLQINGAPTAYASNILELQAKTAIDEQPLLKVVTKKDKNNAN